MANLSRFKMSQERLDAIKEELNYLETVREKEVAELIKEARSFGDLSENSEYDEAKTEQGKLYSKIAELKVLIENAESSFAMWTMILRRPMRSLALRRQTPAWAGYPMILPSVKGCTATAPERLLLSPRPRASLSLR